MQVAHAMHGHNCFGFIAQAGISSSGSQKACARELHPSVMACSKAAPPKRLASFRSLPKHYLGRLEGTTAYERILLKFDSPDGFRHGDFFTVCSGTDIPVPAPAPAKFMLDRLQHGARYCT